MAAPSLRDPNFRRAVVLLVEHNDDGALGFVINRASTLDLRALAKGVAIAPEEVKQDGTVLVGGPVSPETGWIVFDPAEVGEMPEGSVVVAPSVGVSKSRALLLRLLHGELGARQLMVLGYAGWGAGQLDDELAQGAWIPVDLDQRVVFETPLDDRWGRALRGAGIDPARLSVLAPSEA